MMGRWQERGEFVKRARASRRSSNRNQSMCYVATTARTLRAFVVPVAEYLSDDLGLDISLVCAGDKTFAAELPQTLGYHPINMKRGIDPHSLAAIWRMWRLFQTERFCAVEYTTPNASFYASLAASLARVPVRIYRQGGIRYVGFSGVRRRVFRQIERWTCQLSSCVEPVSRGNLSFGVAERLYPLEKASVVWNGSACGVDLARFDATKRDSWRIEARSEFCIPMGGFVMGFVGRLSRDKGGNELLEAAQCVIGSNQLAYLLIVGPLDETGGLQGSLMRWARTEGRVIFCGSRQDVPRCMAAMDALVMPTYREGFGQVLIEAQAMGVPVITTAVPGPLDAVIPGVTALVVQPMNVAELEVAIREVAGDERRRTQLSRAGLEYVRSHFDKQIFMRRLAVRRAEQLSICNQPPGEGAWQLEA